MKNTKTRKITSLVTKVEIMDKEGVVIDTFHARTPEAKDLAEQKTAYQPETYYLLSASN